jgi:predicted metal-dependent hydrolase
VTPAEALGLAPGEGEAFARGVRLFNERRFYESHDVLEELWRPLRGPGRSFLQGLIQVAVALHHLEQGNRRGAQSVLERARRRLAPYAPAAFGFDVAGYLDELAAFWDAPGPGGPPPWRFTPPSGPTPRSG